MGLKNWFIQKVSEEIIKDPAPDLVRAIVGQADDDIIRVEAALRRFDNTGKGISGTVKKESTFFIAKKIADWKLALAVATDLENPELAMLADLYENLLLDAHLNSVIESRVMRVLRSKYTLSTEKGENNPDAIKLLQKPWFETFVTVALMSKFTGVKLVELYDTDDEGELLRSTEIPMAHLNPWKGIILKEVGDTTGQDYRKGALSNYYIQVGENGDLGILADIAPLVLAKKQAMGAWIDYIEKFGIPPLIINTANMDATRQRELLDMGMKMHNNHVVVLQGNETFALGEQPANQSGALFQDFLKTINSELSKRILGQDATTENQENTGTYGSMKVMQEVAEDRHESDKLFIQYIINKQLLKKLPVINSYYAPLQGLVFDWDESDEMSKEDIIDKAVALTQAGYELDTEELSEKTGFKILGFRQPGFGQPPADPKQEEKKKDNRFKIAAFYSDVSEAFFEPQAVNLTVWNKVMERIAKDLHSGKLKREDLDAELIQLIYAEMLKGARTGWGEKDWKKALKDKDETVLKIQKNLYVFSGAKSYNQLLLMNDLLTDANGVARSFADFKTEMLKVHEEYNLNYLQAEFQTANRASKAAKDWQKFEANKDIFPNLKYRTVRDSRVRDDHRKLDDIVKPVDDPFWDKNYPPNGWRCRCFVQATTDKVTTGTPTIKTVKGFGNNVGKTGSVFDNENHPYFALPKDELKRLYKKLEDGRKDK